MPTEQEIFGIEWKRLGEHLADTYGKHEGQLSNYVAKVLPRIARQVPSMGVGVPCAPGRSVVQETLQLVSKLAYEFGMVPVTTQGFEIANNREHLVDAFVNAKFERMLFLDSDTVVDAAGVFQLLKTMEQQDAAMVSALVPQRYIGETDFNALRDGDEEKGEPKYVPLKREDLPSTLTSFPVHTCGLAVAVLDLSKIAKVPGPRFARQALGNAHHGEDAFFCEWLRKNDLTFFVDPKVATMHCVQHRFVYQPQVNKD